MGWRTWILCPRAGWKLRIWQYGWHAAVSPMLFLHAGQKLGRTIPSLDWMKSGVSQHAFLPKLTGPVEPYDFEGYCISSIAVGPHHVALFSTDRHVRSKAGSQPFPRVSDRRQVPKSGHSGVADVFGRRHGTAARPCKQVIYRVGGASIRDTEPRRDIALAALHILAD